MDKQKNIDNDSANANFTVTQVQYDIEDQNDDTFVLRAASGAKCRYKKSHSVANEPYYKLIHSEKEFASLLKQCDNTPNPIERMFEAKADKKWIYPQGGSFSKEQLIQGLLDYFETVHTNQAPNDEWLEAAAYLHKLTKVSLRNCKLITRNPRKLYRFWKGDHRSSGGVTFLGDRRTPGIAPEAIRQALANPYQIDPTIAGMRLKDNKYRNIFGDSFANYYREAMFLHNIFEVWESLPFDSNKGDMHCAKRIVQFQAQSSKGKDYRAMDKHDSYDAVVKLLLCLIYWFDAPADEIHKIIFWLRDLFQQSVLVADELWTPTDYVNLLSGLYPTHDVEGMQNTLINTRALMDCGYTIVTEPRKLKRGEATFIVCGDDITVLFGDTNNDAFDAAIQKRAAEWGQIIADDKDEDSHEVAFFCKKAYALRGDNKGFRYIQFDGMQVPVPKYSLKKVLNSIYHPENYPRWATAAEVIAWFSMIYDNGFGDKMWKSVLKTIFDRNRDIFTVENIDAAKNLAQNPDFLATVRSDWWLNKCFDEHLITKSYTIYQLLIWLN